MEIKLHTKMPDTCNSVLSTIWGSNNEGLHACGFRRSDFVTSFGGDNVPKVFAYMSVSHALARFRAYSMSNFRLAYMLVPFWCVRLPLFGIANFLSRFLAWRLVRFLGISLPDFRASYLTNRSPDQGTPRLLDGFWILAFAQISLPEFLAGFWRKDPTLTRSSHGIDIKKRAKGIDPVLLSLDQKGDENELNNLEIERIGSILVPISLQNDVVMNSFAKFANVVSLPVTQVYSASDVEVPSGNVPDLVNARHCRDRVVFWGIMQLHLHNLLHRLVGVLSGLASTTPTPPHYTPSTPSLSSSVGVRYGN